MATYTNPDGRVFTIPTYSDFSDGPQNFKDFAATMPSYGNDVYDVSGTVQFTAHHTSRVVKFTAAGEYVVDDTAPTGTQVTIATWNAFVSVMTSGVQVEPATERLIPPYSMVVLTKVGAGMWLVAKGSGGAGNYFNSATGGTVTEIADYNGTGETWRVHTFTSSSTFEVLDALEPFRVLVVAGGGPGGHGRAFANPDRGWAPGAGGGGAFWANDSVAITPGAIPVTVGAGGISGSTGSIDGNGSGGGQSSFLGNTVNGGGSGYVFGSGGSGSGFGGGGTHVGSDGDRVARGGGGGATGAGGNPPQNGNPGDGGIGGPGVKSTISGALLGYGGGGGGSANFATGGMGQDGGGQGNAGISGVRGGGGGGGKGDSAGGNGGSGVVIVSYQIG